ncbi:hypothetical protein HX004_06985 [Myroides sp. 1354]|uniref:hypothetical protein n=1 Tax=unclassified Myroides TaxID=2642485 RepID=UPI002578A30D|nr:MULTISPECIES: hypothetical protein [unclassified Myroides]MDM1044806.1 hypothetical protein [Myroides sp. R163-1]MDM1055519.1 hypothetical protein [Myroides sp. 1354]MDM1068816.1 hypothetical protein [Myroides sp. 1372]
MNEQTSFGLISTVEVPFAIQAMGSCWAKKGLLVANYVFTDAEDPTAFELVYTLIDEEGGKREIVESEGILPTLFLNPLATNFVAVVGDKDESESRQILPVFKRNIGEQFTFDKDLAGRFVGCTKASTIFYEVDIWKESKQDIMTCLAFHENDILGCKQITVPMPKGNKVCVQNGEIHLITEVESGWLHRQINESGQEIRSRVLDFDFPFVHEALSLSFDKKSYLLCEENGEIGLVEIDEEGNCLYAELYNLGDEFFGTWHPQHLNEETSAVQFTTEHGNGWLVVRHDSLVELVYNKNKSGYKNLLSQEVLNLDTNDLAVSSISPISDTKIGIVFHPRKPRKEKYQKVYVLQHGI